MSRFFNKLHLATCAIHDTIWDTQNWFGDKLHSALNNLKDSWKRLTSGFSWWSPLRLLETLLWLPPIAARVLLTAFATIIAIGLSLTIDTVKLAAFCVDQLVSKTYQVAKRALAFFRNKPAANLGEAKQQNDLEINPNIYQQDWYKIIEYARFAPSPHNLQPWLFDLQSKDQATLMYDPKRLLPNTNPNGSYMFVGFGILFETMSIAAAKLGKEVDVKLADNVELDAKKNALQKLATLRIVDRQSKEAESLDPQLIIDRRTSRLPYNGKPLTSTVINELSSVAKRYGHTMGFSSDYRMVDWVIELNTQAMHFDMSHGRTRNELRPWFRYSQSDAKKQADGLAAYTMNTSPLELWLFSNVNWLFRIPGVAHLARRNYKNSMSGTATVTWLSGPFNTRDDWINAGRMMARWWLTMTKHDVYLHPFGSVITNPEAFQRLNDKLKNEQLDVRPESDKQANPIWMLTRNGYSRPGEKPPQAQRMPLSKMIISSNNWCSLFSQKSSQPTQRECNPQYRSPVIMRSG